MNNFLEYVATNFTSLLGPVEFEALPSGDVLASIGDKSVTVKAYPETDTPLILQYRLTVAGVQLRDTAGFSFDKVPNGAIARDVFGNSAPGGGTGG